MVDTASVIGILVFTAAMLSAAWIVMRTSMPTTPVEPAAVEPPVDAVPEAPSTAVAVDPPAVDGPLAVDPDATLTQIDPPAVPDRALAAAAARLLEPALLLPALPAPAGAGVAAAAAEPLGAVAAAEPLGAVATLPRPIFPAGVPVILEDLGLDEVLEAAREEEVAPRHRALRLAGGIAVSGVFFAATVLLTVRGVTALFGKLFGS